MLLFKSNRPLFFMEISVGEDKAVMEGDKVVIGGFPQPPLGTPCSM